VLREKAYRWVQRNAMKVWEGEGTMLELCLKDRDLVKVLGEKGVRTCFDLKHLLRHADVPFRRALRSA
jgi:adenylosuccinate lyase